MPMLETKGAASVQGLGRFSSSATPGYIEDVFAVDLWSGTGGTLAINNGIDLSTKGGMVLIKGRAGTTLTTGPAVFDTTRGRASGISSASTNAAVTSTAGNDLVSFDTTGFTVGPANQWSLNATGTNYVGYTFRKQKKFFDIVTGTGWVTAAHNLGVVPAMIWIKNTASGVADWVVWHKDLTGGINGGNVLVLDQNWSEFGNGSPSATDTNFDSTFGGTGSSQAWVAYLFSSDAGGFGASGLENGMTCGSYTGNGSGTGPTITLGYEPAFVMIKNVSGSGNWVCIDNMRGWDASLGKTFYFNSVGAEAASSLCDFTPTGFRITTPSSFVNTNAAKYLYWAVRRGPMRTPTTGSSVFQPVAYTGTGAAATITGPNFMPDIALFKRRSPGGGAPTVFDRLRGPTRYVTTDNSTGIETTTADTLTGFDLRNAVTLGADATTGAVNTSGSTYVAEFIRRAFGFCDVVRYSGTGANQTLTHNLGATPELMIIKRRTGGTSSWAVYHKILGGGYYLALDTTAAQSANSGMWNNTAPTSVNFTVGTDAMTNVLGATYVAYLFASCPGVSVISAYTGNGTSGNMSNSFTPRFVMIKRADNVGDWYVWDSARGIISGNDPHFSLNNSLAEVTTDDSLYLNSPGWGINQVAATNINVSGASYIYLAIA